MIPQDHSSRESPLHARRMIKKIAPTIENRMLISLVSLKVAGTMLGWELRGCSERQKSPHTDVSAEKLLRDARMAGLVKLRRGIQRTGQCRVWAGRYIHAALQSPLFARYEPSLPPLRMAVSWILQICCGADHPLFTPREGPSGGIAKKLTASQLTAER